jgi:hypothetical protein
VSSSRSSDRVGRRRIGIVWGSDRSSGRWWRPIRLGRGPDRVRPVLVTALVGGASRASDALMPAIGSLALTSVLLVPPWRRRRQWCSRSGDGGARRAPVHDAQPRLPAALHRGIIGPAIGAGGGRGPVGAVRLGGIVFLLDGDRRPPADPGPVRTPRASRTSPGVGRNPVPGVPLSASANADRDPPGAEPADALAPGAAPSTSPSARRLTSPPDELSAAGVRWLCLEKPREADRDGCSASSGSTRWTSRTSSRNQRPSSTPRRLPVHRSPLRSSTRRARDS